MDFIHPDHTKEPMTGRYINGNEFLASIKSVGFFGDGNSC
jgi:hypothetical protein